MAIARWTLLRILPTSRYSRVGSSHRQHEFSRRWWRYWIKGEEKYFGWFFKFRWSRRLSHRFRLDFDSIWHQLKSLKFKSTISPFCPRNSTYYFLHTASCTIKPQILLQNDLLKTLYQGSKWRKKSLSWIVHEKHRAWWTWKLVTKILLIFNPVNRYNQLSDLQLIACVLWSISIIEFSIFAASCSGDVMPG